MKTRICNAQVVFPNEVLRTNVLIDDGKIVAINDLGSTRVDEELDASGMTLLPGVIDSHVHFRDPGLTYKEDLYSASRACAKGGVTSFLEMPNTRPSVTTQARLAYKLALASKKSIVNYGFFIGATPDNIAELRVARRTPGIKIFMGSSTGELLVDDQQALERIFAETSLPIAVHSEDETLLRINAEKFGKTTNLADHSRIRNANVAEIATKRVIELAKRFEHQTHILHISSANEVDLLAKKPDFITAEVCPHHLLFSTEDYSRLGSRVQMNPSIKPPNHATRLWQALHDGIIHTIATDHAPHTLLEKARPYPNSPSGIPSIENALALMLHQANLGNCSLQEIAHWMSFKPAEVWGILNKGRIAVGYDADLVLVDMNKKQRILDEKQISKCGWSPWHGEMITGWPIRTWVKGNTVFADQKVISDLRGTELLFA